MTGMNTGYEGTNRMHDTSVFVRHDMDNGVKIWIQDCPLQVDKEGLLVAFFDGIGTAHFFEHMPFRGTSNMPTVVDIKNSIRQCVGSDNAFVHGFHGTAFCMEAVDSSFRQVIDILYDLAFSALLRPEDIESEKGVIKSEYYRAQASPGTHLLRYISKYYFNYHPMSLSPLGELSVIEGMIQEKLICFRDKFYCGSNLHIFCGGSFSKDASNLFFLEEKFSSIPKGEIFRLETEIPLPFNNSKIVEVEDQKCGRDWLFVYFPIQSVSIKDDLTLCLLSDVLAEDMDSPVLAELRTKRGLVYDGDLCDFAGRRDFAGFAFECPISHEYFDLAYDVFFTALENLEAGYIKRLRLESQRSRLLAFQHPISAVKSAYKDISRFGRVVSWREVEDVYDSIVSDDVFSWRDRLLKINPFVLKIKGM